MSAVDPKSINFEWEIEPLDYGLIFQEDNQCTGNGSLSQFDVKADDVKRNSLTQLTATAAHSAFVNSADLNMSAASYDMTAAVPYTWSAAAQPLTPVALSHNLAANSMAAASSGGSGAAASSGGSGSLHSAAAGGIAVPPNLPLSPISPLPGNNSSKPANSQSTCAVELANMHAQAENYGRAIKAKRENLHHQAHQTSWFCAESKKKLLIKREQIRNSNLSAPYSAQQREQELASINASIRNYDEIAAKWLPYLHYPLKTPTIPAFQWALLGKPPIQILFKQANIHEFNNRDRVRANANADVAKKNAEAKRQDIVRQTTKWLEGGHERNLALLHVLQIRKYQFYQDYIEQRDPKKAGYEQNVVWIKRERSLQSEKSNAKLGIILDQGYVICVNCRLDGKLKQLVIKFSDNGNLIEDIIQTKQKLIAQKFTLEVFVIGGNASRNLRESQNLIQECKECEDFVDDAKLLVIPDKSLTDGLKPYSPQVFILFSGQGLEYSTKRFF